MLTYMAFVVMQVGHLFACVEDQAPNKLVLTTSIPASYSKVLYFVRNVEQMVLPETIQVGHIRQRLLLAVSLSRCQVLTGQRGSVLQRKCPLHARQVHHQQL